MIIIRLNKILFTIFLFLIFDCCVAQSKDIIAYLHPLEVKNKIVMDILNVIESEMEECVFAKHGFPYCYGINALLLDSEKIHVSFYSIQNYFIHSPYIGYGYFYFNDKIVIVEKPDFECNLYGEWFEIKENIDTFLFVRPTTKVFFTPKSCIGIEQVNYTYLYRDDSMVLIRSKHCTHIEKYYHQISYSDSSWQQIANLYRISLESLKDKNKHSVFKSPPKKGKVVRIY